MVEFLRKLDEIVCKVLLVIGEIAVLALTVIVTYTVIARFVFNTGNSWAEEVPRVLVSIFAFLACALGVRDHLHTSVTVIYDRFKEGGTVQKVLDVLTDVVVLLCGILMLWVGSDAVASKMAKGGILPMTGWPEWLSYISIPVSGAFIIFFCVLFLVGVIKKTDTFFTKVDDDPLVQAKKMREAQEAAQAKNGKEA